MVTFGGAYTTLPFIYAAAVQSGGWLSQRAFLDAIAITNMMPTPLVMFVTLVGYVGHGVIGTQLCVLFHSCYKIFVGFIAYGSESPFAKTHHEL